MFLQLTFLIYCVVSPNTFGQIIPIIPLPDTGDSGQIIPLTSSTYAQAVLALFSNANLFDAPPSVSHAPTTPTTNFQPTLEDIIYYNNYAAAMYCQYHLWSLNCTPCEGFKKDVSYHRVIMNNVTDTTALVAASIPRGELVVAFRGTMNAMNIIQDAALIPMPYPETPGVKLHTGFVAAVMSLYKEVVETIGYLQIFFPKFKIVITGQSLGAAMARLFQFFLLANNQFPDTTYVNPTYGEPRCGNAAFANYMNNQNITTARVVNKADIVAHVPPTSTLGDYVHCQPEYWCAPDNSQRFCNTSVYEDPTCSDSLGPNYNIGDHGEYMNVSYTTCILGQPVPWLAVPIVFQPVGTTVPELPEFIPDFTACNFP